MIFSIRITDEAQQDLDQIAEWYIQRNPGGRERFINDFDMALTVLARFPFAGRERFKRIGLRGYPVSPYLLLYRVDERAKEVVALSIAPAKSGDIDPDEFD